MHLLEGPKPTAFPTLFAGEDGEEPESPLLVSQQNGVAIQRKVWQFPAQLDIHFPPK